MSKSEFSLDQTTADGDKDVSEIAGRTDMIKLSGNIISSINYKLGAFTFVLGVLLMSDTFVENVLSKMNGMVHGECTTTQGTFVQLVLLIIGMLIIDLLVRADWI